MNRTAKSATDGDVHPGLTLAIIRALTSMSASTESPHGENTVPAKSFPLTAAGTGAIAIAVSGA
jgi:hypothetical protein